MLVTKITTKQKCAEYGCTEEAEFEIKFGYFSVLLCSGCAETLKRKLKGGLNKWAAKCNSKKVKPSFIVHTKYRDEYTNFENSHSKGFKKESRANKYIEEQKEFYGKRLIDIEIENFTNAEVLMSETINSIMS